MSSQIFFSRCIFVYVQRFPLHPQGLTSLHLEDTDLIMILFMTNEPKGQQQWTIMSGMFCVCNLTLDYEEQQNRHRMY